MQDKCLRGAKLVKKSLSGEVYLLRSGEYFKKYDSIIRQILNSDHSLERKITSARPIENVPEIIVPTTAVYNRQNQFVGYITQPAEGIDLNRYQLGFNVQQRTDLNQYGMLFSNISKAVERANKRNIVFPDLCTCDNIFINNGKISFIDFDGLQIGKHKVYGLSTSLGDESQYENKKYKKGELFTSELDKKSLVLLYFLVTFNIDLNKIGNINPYTGEVLTLYHIFDMLGLKDFDLMQKVYNTLSSDKPGEYIADDAMRIAEEYNMYCLGQISEGIYIKKLLKK